MKIVCLSDTHGLHDKVTVPDGDVLIFAGDCCGHGTLVELNSFVRWFKAQPHRHKLFVAGNHDWPFEKYTHLAIPRIEDEAGALYLQDRAVQIDGLNFYGSPWQPEFCGWAFNVAPGPELVRIWDKIPEDTDVLITHGPALGDRDKNPYGQHVGCWALHNRLLDLNVRLHIFGHIHGGSGVTVYKELNSTSVNAAICDEAYNATNPCRVVEIEAHEPLIS